MTEREIDPEKLAALFAEAMRRDKGDDEFLAEALSIVSLLDVDAEETE